MTVHAILNPAARGGRAGLETASLVARLSRAFPGITVHETTHPGHATTLARDLAQGQATQLLAVGGDGTWHEVVNGVMLVPRESPLPLSLIPRGTGGDMRRSLGVPRDLDAAIRRARAAPPRPVDAARLAWTEPDGTSGSVVVANIASLGMSADVARRTHEGTVTKARFGAAAFFVEGVAAALDRQRHAVRLTIDDHPPIATTVLLCAACNGHTFGGGMRIAPMARLDDGWLDVVWINALPRAALLGLLPGVYGGMHTRLPWVHHVRARHVVIERQAEGPVEADGELPGVTGRLTIDVLPAALRVT